MLAHALSPAASAREADVKWLRTLYGQLYGKGVVDRGYAAVVYPDKLVEPQATSRTSFRAGHLEGWVVLYDLVNAKPLCAKKLSVTSSEDVGRRVLDTAAEVVKKDFRVQTVKALEKALEDDGLDMKHYDHDHVL